MPRPILAMFLLALLSVSCVVQALPLQFAQKGHVSANSSISETYGSHIPEITITGKVHVRDWNGVSVGTLTQGTVINAWCGRDVCYYGEYTVWRGCTSEANGLKCENR